MSLPTSPTVPDEADLRRQLAASYRIFAMLGWTELIYNHITVRVPGPQKHFLINPFGLHYTEVTASNLVKIDLQGRVVGESRHAVNPAGFTIHSAIHGAIDDAHCVMHTHTTTGCAVAGSQCGLSPDNFYAASLEGQVATHDFEGITVHPDEGPRLVASLGRAHTLILRNHGLLSWGATIPQAFVYLYTLQRACDVQVAGASLGPAIPIPESIRRKSSADALQFDVRFGAGQDVFDAMTRLVDRIDPSYRD